MRSCKRLSIVSCTSVNVELEFQLIFTVICIYLDTVVKFLPSTCIPLQHIVRSTRVDQM